MLLGASIAAHHGGIAWGWLAVTVFGIFCVEAAKNASGDVFDWDSGADAGVTEAERTPFSGGKRIIVDGLLSRREATLVAAVFYLLAGVSGLTIVIFREPTVLLLGFIGMSLAYFYHAPPLALSYRGWGEAAVAIAYGPIIACGTYLVQRGVISTEVFAASLPLGVAIMAFLWINEFPDARADAIAGKRTLVVRLGRAKAASVFVVLIAAAFFGVAVLPLAGLPLGIWLGLIGLPHGALAAHRLLRFPDTPRKLIAAQAWTLLSFVLLALGSAVGIVVTG